MKKKPREMICGDCFQRFPDWQAVRDHVRTAHNREPWCDENIKYPTPEKHQMARDIVALAEGYILSA